MVWSAPLVLALVGAALALVASVQTKHACAILATVCAAIVVFLLWTGA